ncbi:MAG: (d)CMP kinase [Alphaproteobacteria bacterium]
MVIAIDGPAAAGKGTLARRLAEQFGLAHLDTGLLYRATAVRLLLDGGDPNSELTASAAARSLSTNDLRGPELLDEQVARLASVVAVHDGVRAALLDFQRSFAASPPNGARGAVLDGRDIGSVILPDADIKIFVTANSDVRADRRYQELRARGVHSIKSLVLKKIQERDERDRHREVAPMVPVEDAFLLDTTNMDADTAFEAAYEFVMLRQTSNGRNV